MSTLIFLDAETGGLNAVTDALLSVGMVAFDTHTQEIVKSVEVLVRSEDLNVDPKALAVNKIDLPHHNGMAFTRRDAVKEIAAFVLPEWRRAQMVCHNSAFDKPFMEALLGDQFKTLFGFQPLCTMQLAQWLSHRKLLPMWTTSVAKLCTHFGVDPGEAHTALADATATVHLYQHLMALEVPA